MNILPLLTFYFLNSQTQFVDRDIKYQIARSLLFVIEEFFVPRSSSFALILSCDRQETTNFYNDLVEVIFNYWGNIKTQIVVNSEASGQISFDDRVYNLLLVDSSESFLKIDLASKVQNYDNSEFYHIVLQNQDHLLPDDIQQILNYCWKNYIVNVNIQVQKSSGEIILYTYFPFSETHCGKVVPVEINRYRNQKWDSNVLFQKKVRNMHNCPVKVGTWQVPPYMMLDLTKKGRAAIGGFEGKLLLQLSYLMNFNIRIIVPPNNEQRGLVLGNQSTGATGMLLRKKIDLGVGAFSFIPSRSRLLTGSQAYYQVSNAAVLLASSANYSPVQTLWFPFKRIASACLLAAFLITFGLLRVLYLLLRKWSSNNPAMEDRNITFNFIACTLGLPSSLDARWNAGRIFIMAWMLFGLVIRTQFGAAIYQLIRHNLFRKPPSTLRDVAKLNYTFALNSIAFNAVRQTSIFADSGLPILLTPNGYPGSDFGYLEDHPNEKFLTIAPLYFLLYYLVKNRKRGIQTILKESFMQQSSCIYFPKHSYMAAGVNVFIQRINEVGLMDGWLKQSMDLTYLFSRQTQKVFTIGQRELKGIYYLCGIMLGVSFLVFCLEIMSLKFAFLRKMFRKF